jgi:hypothetical protein
VEKEAGLSAGQEADIIAYLWNRKEDAHHQLRELHLHLKELHLHDTNLAEGLKVNQGGTISLFQNSLARIPASKYY